MESSLFQNFKQVNLEDVFTYSEEDLVKYYDRIGLFFNGVCEICSIFMNQQIDRSKSYSEQKLYCSKCKFVANKRYNTIFFGMKISFITFNTFLYYFSQGFTDKEIELIMKPFSNTKMSYCSIRQYSKLCRDICHIYVQSILQDIKFEGTVEVDEACIYKLRKGRNGRIAKIVYWVFGLKSRLTKQVIIYPVLYRKREILINIVKKHVKPGSLILSDRFSAYWNNRTSPPTSHLIPHGYLHLGINHSIHFVSDINNQIHTNTIERVWRSLKGKFKNFKPKKQIQQTISQFIMETWIPKEDRYYFMLYLIYEFNCAI